MAIVTYTLGVALAINIAIGRVVTQQFPVPPTKPKLGISPFQNVTIPTCTTQTNATLSSSKNGIIDTKYRWTIFSVHPDKNYTKLELEQINNAIYRISQVIPCVKFGIWPQDSTPTGDYVRIIKGSKNGCSSLIGRQGGAQDMNLQSPGCMGVGTIMHEMIHALGFRHEQARPDRDDYVTVLYENMMPGREINFKKYPATEVATFGVPYNTKSIMHYESYAFSANGQPTILTKNGTTVKPETDLQQTDIQKLKLMYNC